LVDEVKNISLMFSTLVNSSVGKIELKKLKERARERDREKRRSEEQTSTKPV
jgi:hypothetical protein